MILINSAAYVNPEFRNEFGLIPPVFLPVGNKKLLSYQVENLRKSFPSDIQIVVSLPLGYGLSIDEEKTITDLGVLPVFVDENLSLGMSILYVLNTVEGLDSTLYLLHGDTLLYDVPIQSDCITLAKTQDDYTWEFDSSNKLVWCGYFSFGEVRRLIRELAITQGDFIKSVHRYTHATPKMSYIEVDGWHDLGHTNTYFRSRSKITTQRAFNFLRIEEGVVWKSGTPAIKIKAEANWFASLPPKLKRFTPQLIQVGIQNNHPFYETEYVPCLPLNEIFVHGKNPLSFWENILGLLGHYLEKSRECFDGDEIKSKIGLDSIALYENKTLERLEGYASQKGLDLDKITQYDGVILPSLRQIARDCIDRTLKLPVVYAIAHGDLCFSNIMYDSRSNSLKVIDPRGLNFQQELTIYGNQTYDLAKLSHSFVGLYDFIIADSFEIKKSDRLGVSLKFNLDERLINIQNAFMEKQLLPGVSIRDIMPATILLFLSMIPLHFDKPHRQEAMLANALRLYTQIT